MSLRVRAACVFLLIVFCAAPDRVAATLKAGARPRRISAGYGRQRCGPACKGDCPLYTQDLRCLLENREGYRVGRARRARTMQFLSAQFSTTVGFGTVGGRSS